MSKKCATEPQIDWSSDDSCETVRTAMFFDIFMKMNTDKQTLILEILNVIKKGSTGG